MSATTLPPPQADLASPECIPDLSQFQVEDGAPVDSIYHGYQQQLLVDAIQSSWTGPGEGRPFFVVSDCGLFYAANKPPAAPDVMLSVDVRLEELADPLARRSYFVWVIGKPPEVVVEMTSITPGGEDTTKLALYARIGVPYYAIFDPHHYIGPEEFRLFARRRLGYEQIDPKLMEGVGLGMTVWDGIYGGAHARWLRWTDRDGNLIPTGAERAEAEKSRAEAEKSRAETEKKRAETERKRAETERKRAEAAESKLLSLEEKLARYAAKLHDAGMSANGDS